MFNPNNSCIIIKSEGTDVYGQPLQSRRLKERCAVLRALRQTEKSSVRADSSASRGNAIELTADGWLLLTKRTKAEIDDLIVVAGMTLKIAGLHPRYDLLGRLDHYEALCTVWNEEAL